MRHIKSITLSLALLGIVASISLTVYGFSSNGPEIPTLSADDFKVQFSESFTDSIVDFEQNHINVDSVGVAFYMKDQEIESGPMELTVINQSYRLIVEAAEAATLNEIDSIEVIHDILNLTEFTNVFSINSFINMPAEPTFGSFPFSWESRTVHHSPKLITSSHTYLALEEEVETSHISIPGGLAVVVITIDPAASVTVFLKRINYKTKGSDQWQTAYEDPRAPA